jgi:hypothetical protein
MLEVCEGASAQAKRIEKLRFWTMVFLTTGD